MTSSRDRSGARRWLPHVVAAFILGVLLVWDQQVYGAIAGFRSPFLDWLTGHVSKLRGATFPLVVALVLIAVGFIAKRRRLRRAGAAALLTVLLAGVITSALKEIIARPGPQGYDIQPGESWLDARYGRFPSSHSAITFGAASVLAAFVPAAAVPGFAVAVLVSHERIYRGTHFPSDIFAGFWIGLVVARFVIAQLAQSGWGEDLLGERHARTAFSLRWTGDKRPGGDQEPAA